MKHLPNTGNNSVYIGSGQRGNYATPTGSNGNAKEAMFVVRVRAYLQTQKTLYAVFHLEKKLFIAGVI